MKLLYKIIIRILVNGLIVGLGEWLYLLLHSEINPVSGKILSIFVLPVLIILLLLFVINKVLNKNNTLRIPAQERFSTVCMGIAITLIGWGMAGETIAGETIDKQKIGYAIATNFVISFIVLIIVVIIWLMKSIVYKKKN